MITKSEIFKTISSQYLKLSGRKRKITSPRDISIEMNDNGTAFMRLSRKGVLGNMQSNSSCFEGWSLSIFRWIHECEEVSLSWEEPKPMTTKETGHYQRFLFRAMRFSESISWFRIDNSCKKLLQDSILIGDTALILNEPSEKRKRSVPSGNLDQLSENQLELKLVSDDELNKSLCQLSDSTYIDNQLPIGLFKDSVKKKNLVFTGGKSAVDMWGVNKDKKVAKLFELKKAGSIPIGIITELLFYSFVVNLVQSGRVELPSSLGIQDTQTVDGFLIGPKFHPLIDTESLSILNKELRNIPFPITIDAIIIEPDFELRHLNLTS